jgi:ParB family chromosome partitioning protein
MTKQVLGKGLSALIPANKELSTSDTSYRVIPLDRIAPNPMQPRRHFDDVRLAELAESLKLNGLVQPLVVKRNGGGFTIIAGERRYRAARIAGLESAPAVIMDEIDDIRMLELALVENIQREDLNPIELAEAYRRLIEQCGLTQAQMAARVGRSRAAVANHLRLLTLPDQVRSLLIEGKLTEGHARAILSLETEAEMVHMAERIVEGSLSVREAETARPRKKRRRLIVRRLSPEISEMESDLKQRLATSVKILPGLKRGKIEIEYYGEDDLSRLWQLFRKIEQ